MLTKVDKTHQYTEKMTETENGIYTSIKFKNYEISFISILCEKESKIEFPKKNESIKMHFVYYKNSLKTITLNEQKIECNHHNIIYSPSEEFKYITPNNNELQLFEINLNINFFKKHIPKEHPYIILFMDAIRNKKAKQLSHENLIITSQMMYIINAIINCKRVGTYKELFVESKIIELFLIQLEQIADSKYQVKLNLKETEIQKMHQVREIIMSDLKQSFSLKSLAYQIGTNEFTLKKSFKAYYGTSVFRFINDIKMKIAKDLLIEQNVTITHISEVIGYKNATHFTTAFKKKYNVLPSVLRKQTNLGHNLHQKKDYLD